MAAAHTSSRGGDKTQGAAALTSRHPELIDLCGIGRVMMELVVVDPLLNIAIIFYLISWTTLYN